MTSLLRQGLLAASVASILSLTSVAHGDDDGIPLRVHVTKTDATACTDSAGFVEAVHAVDPKVRVVESPDAPLADVTFQPRSSGGFRGELRFEQPGGALLTRTAEGNDCADVTRALSLVVALQAAEAAASKPPPTPEPASARDESPERVAPAPRPPVTVHSVYVGGGVHTGIVSEQMSPSASISYALEARNERKAIAIRGGLLFGQDTTDLATARVVTTLVDACPIAVGTRRRVMFAPCLRGEFGVKSLSARYRGETDMALWSDIGGALTLGVHVVSGLTVELDVAALKTLTRTDFVVTAPDFGYELRRVEASTPPFVLSAGLSIGWSFWTDLGARQ